MTIDKSRRRTCNVEDAAEVLGISRTKAYECVRTGEIRSFRIGRKILVPLAALDELLGTDGSLPAADHRGGRALP